MTYGATELWTFLLVFARTTSLFVTAPVFGTRSVPTAAKVGLAAMITFATLPLALPLVSRPPASLPQMVVGIGGEVAVGICLGYLTTLLFAAIQMAGVFIDTQMGFGIMQVLNPITEQQASVLGQFLYQLGITLFLIVNGHVLLIRTVVNSFAMVGPGGAHFAGDSSGVMIAIVTQMFTLAVRVALPAAAVLLVVDAAFGIVARSVPQMNVFIVGMPVKIVIGLLTVALVLPVVAMAVSQIVPLSVVDSGMLLKAAR